MPAVDEAAKEALVARLADAFELTLILSVISDMSTKLKVGSENRIDLERTERTLFRMYRNLVRHRDVALLEPEWCDAAQAALEKARAVHRAELIKLMETVGDRVTAGTRTAHP
jgi:hypothetical protein